jgi:hypothetical protein
VQLSLAQVLALKTYSFLLMLLSLSEQSLPLV